MKRIIDYIFFIFLLLTLHSLVSVANNYGVGFHAHSTPPDYRTVILLNEGKPISTGRQFALSFQMSLQRKPFFGKLFCVHTNDGHHIDGMFAVYQGNDRDPRPALLIDGKLSFMRGRVEPTGQVGVGIALDATGNRVVFQYGSEQMSVGVDLSGMSEATVRLGKHSDASGNSDVAPIELWDVAVSRDGKTRNLWRLSHHNDSVCYDDIAHSKAIVRHGRWLLNEHVEWQSVYQHDFKGTVQTAYDEAKGLFYITDDKYMTVLDPVRKTTSQRVVSRGYRATKYSNHLVCDPRRGRLVSFDLERGAVATMDMERAVWDNASEQTEEPVSYNQAVAWQGDSVLFLFGGYGHYRFGNTLWKLNLASGSISTIDYAPLLPPRAQAAMACVDGRLYVFGGFGNASGEQEMPSNPYYDLYEIDLRTHKSRQLWAAEVTERSDAFICADRMYWNEHDRSFYVAVSGHRGEMLRVYADRPQWDVVTASLDNDFAYKDLSFSLYRADSLSRFFVVVDKTMNDQSHRINIYSVRQPLQQSNVTTQDEAGSGSTVGWWLLLGVAVCVAIGAGVAMIVRRRRAAKEAVDGQILAVEDGKQAELEPVETTTTVDDDGLRPSSVSILGRFMVIDKQGEDITQRFTPRLRHLLTILMISRLESKQGISVRELEYLLWPDMDDESARNNRNVSVRKLRVLLAGLGDVGITIEKGYAKAVWNRQSVYFDYELLCDELRDDASGNVLSPLAWQLVQRGPLLPQDSYEWLDVRKSRMEGRVVPRLIGMLERAQGEGRLQEVYAAANVLMMYDPFCEQALAAKCSVLRRQQRLDAAHKVYERFCRDYERALGEPYSKSFSDVSQ